MGRGRVGYGRRDVLTVFSQVLLNAISGYVEYF